MLDELHGKGLLIHHWDTDGICSARLLIEHLSKINITNKTPILGNYFLTNKELQNYTNYDFIIIADMALPEDNVLELSKKTKVMIFDHHIQQEIKQVFHYNPVIKEKKPEKHPSTSWIINSFLKNDVNLFALLGIVGDHEEKIENNKPFYKMITDFCNKNNLDFDSMLKMAYLLDSNYKIGDKNAVEKTPHLLLRHGSSKYILENPQWNKNLTKLNEEIKKQRQTPQDTINETILKRINTQYNIISTITRMVAWESGKNTIVINTGFFKDKDQIYMRSNKNVEPMIMHGKSLGFKCGGKKEVLGAVVPKDKTNFFVKELLDFLIR